MFNNSYGPEPSLDFGNFISYLPSILLDIFPITVLMSVILSLINTLKTPANRGFAALFTLITASIIYFGGYTGLYILNDNSTPSPIKKASHLYIEKINPLANSKLFINSKSTAIEIKTNLNSSSFNIITDFNQNIDIQPENPFFTEIFNPPKIFQNLLNDLKIFNRTIKDIYEKSQFLFMTTVLSHIAFAIGCWTIIKLSRWPFLNGLLSIAVIRFFPAYYRLSYSDLTQKAVGFLQTSNAAELAPVAILIVTALLLFLWDILFLKNKNMVNKNG